MKLKELTFKNFRNFEEYHVALGRKTTVFIGRNGMGKTNLIEGMVQSLSFIFSKQRDTPQYEFIRSTDQGVKTFKTTDPRYVNGDYAYPLSISAVGAIETEEGGEVPLEWQFEQEAKKSGLKDSKYRAAYHFFWEYYNNREDKPVFAYFSDGFPHKNTNISSGMKEKLASGNLLPPGDGYYQWDKEQSCVNIWKEYFVQQYLNNTLSFDQAKQDYVDAVTEKMRCFSTSFGDHVIEKLFVQKHDINLDLMILSNDGVERFFDFLPAGYERIYSLALDLASRSYLINKHTNPFGIVFIDEIDLHLHPSLAAEILPALQRTFPRIQFIVSTHSPMVISNMSVNEDNKIIALQKSGTQYFNTEIADMYGINYDFVLSAVMDAEPNNVKLQQLKEKYLRLMRRDKSDLAKETLSAIQEMLSEERFNAVSKELNQKLEAEA